MAERVWDKFLTERDKLVFQASGFRSRAGFGSRPALLIVDAFLRRGRLEGGIRNKGRA
jgi:hypothetical protein